MSKWNRFVDWGNRLYRTCNRITIFVLYVTIMLILGAMIYGANQQRATSNITVTYSRPSYTVSFDPHGGAGTPSSKTVKLGDNYGTLPDITRVGYDFAGWTREDMTIVSPTTQNTTVGDHTLTATWTPKTYSLTLYENKNILYGGELTTTQDLAAWSGTSSTSVTQIATEDNITCTKLTTSASSCNLINQDIYGKIKANTDYIIGVKLKLTSSAGNAFIHMPGTATIDGTSGWGDFMTSGATSIMDNYNKGWVDIVLHRTSKNYTAISSAYFMIYVSDNFTGPLYVKDFTFAEATNTAKSVTYDSAIASVSALSRTGYTFQGYYTQPVGGTKIFNADGSVVKNVSGYTDSNGAWVRDEAINLYGQWKANSYTVTLDRQSGSGGTTSFTAKYNCKPSISIPSRSEHDFKGYYTSTGGGGTQYIDVNGVSSRVWDIASNSTLYANWQQWPVLPSSAGATFVNTQALQNSNGGRNKRVVQIRTTTNASGTARTYQYSWDGSNWSNGSGSSIIVTKTSSGDQTLYVRVYPTGGEHYRSYVQTSTVVHLNQLPTPRVYVGMQGGTSGFWKVEATRKVNTATMVAWATGSKLVVSSPTEFRDDSVHKLAGWSGWILWLTEGAEGHAYHYQNGFIDSSQVNNAIGYQDQTSEGKGNSTPYTTTDDGRLQAL